MEGLIDTRNEYIEHIQDILSVAISKRIYALYTEMMQEKKGLKGFQNELYSIRKWNNNMVNDEYKKIVKYTKCKYLPNLIKSIIITTIKIKIYEYRDQFDNIKIKIPNPEDFVHKCYVNAASFSWKNAYLYNRNNIKDAEYQNNLNIIEENIRSIIKKTFRDFVPFDEIFKQIEDNLTENVINLKIQANMKTKTTTKMMKMKMKMKLLRLSINQRILQMLKMMLKLPKLLKLLKLLKLPKLLKLMMLKKNMKLKVKKLKVEKLKMKREKTKLKVEKLRMKKEKLKAKKIWKE